jgi:hypothetical protein
MHITDDAPSDDPGWIRMDSIILNWISNSISSELHQVVRERGCMERTSFSATVSNILFILRLPLVTLFRATSRCQSIAASSRLWPTVSLASALPLKTGSSPSTFFGDESALRAHGLHHSALLAVSQLSQSSGRPATRGDPHG